MRTPERRRDDENTARPQQTRHLGERANRIGQMLQHLRAEHRVEGRIGLGDIQNVGDDIDFGKVPTSGLQAFFSLAVVDRIVLREIFQMAAKLPVLAFASARIEQSRAGRQLGQHLGDPGIAGRGVSGADGILSLIGRENLAAFDFGKCKEAFDQRFGLDPSGMFGLELGMGCAQILQQTMVLSPASNLSRCMRNYPLYLVHEAHRACLPPGGVRGSVIGASRLPSGITPQRAQRYRQPPAPAPGRASFQTQQRSPVVIVASQTVLALAGKIVRYLDKSAQLRLGGRRYRSLYPHKIRINNPTLPTLSQSLQERRHRVVPAQI